MYKIESAKKLKEIMGSYFLGMKRYHQKICMVYKCKACGIIKVIWF
jgi:hypothetical protein